MNKWGLTLYRKLPAPSPINTRFGLFADIHYKDIDDIPATPRYCRDAITKINDLVSIFDGLDFVIEVGDLFDGGGRTEAQTLTEGAAVNVAYANFAVRYYVPGNHEFDNLTLAQYVAITGSATEGYYSFDVGLWHCIILDGNYSADNDANHYATGYDWHNTYINPAQRSWLTADLAGTEKSNIAVFCHENLGTFIDTDFVLDNAAAVRAILEASGKVKAVFHGHAHVNYLSIINGITYYTMMAATNYAYPSICRAIVNLHNDGGVSVSGYDGQTGYHYYPRAV